MYWCVKGTDFASFYDFTMDFETAMTVWYFFAFQFIALLNRQKGQTYKYIAIKGNIL